MKGDKLDAALRAANEDDLFIIWFDSWSEHQISVWKGGKHDPSKLVSQDGRVTPKGERTSEDYYGSWGDNIRYRKLPASITKKLKTLLILEPDMLNWEALGAAKWKK